MLPTSTAPMARLNTASSANSGRKPAMTESVPGGASVLRSTPFHGPTACWMRWRRPSRLTPGLGIT